MNTADNTKPKEEALPENEIPQSADKVSECSSVTTNKKRTKSRIVLTIVSLCFVLTLVLLAYFAENNTGHQGNTASEPKTSKSTEKDNGLYENDLVESVIPTRSHKDETTAMIDSGNCGKNEDNIKWELYESGTLYIYGQGEMNDYHFDYDSDFNVYIPDYYHYSDEITDAVIEDGVTYIGIYALNGCKSLETIEIPQSVTGIGAAAFSYCTKLKNITLPEGITRIEIDTFRECSSLPKITIPNSVTSIGSSAFEGCRSLKSIAIPESVAAIGEKTFYSCSGLKSITADDNNPYFSSRDNVLFDKDKTVLLLYPSKKQDETYIIPEGVSIIGKNAFYDCTYLTSVEFPKSLTTISDMAFCYCNGLTSVDIPENVSSIGCWSFSTCSGLTSINVNNSNMYYSSQDGVLYDKHKTLLVHYPRKKQDESYTIPDSVTIIGSVAFYYPDENLRKIEIPESVKTIRGTAFCDYHGEIYYNGSREQWQKISIIDPNSELLNTPKHYTSDITE